MSIRLSDIAKFIESFAPTSLAEEWDNVGLMVGSMSMEVKKVLISLDVTSKVVDEAAKQKADMILSHHPLIFKGIKRIDESDIKGRLVHKLIKNSIGVYSAHTNLDVAVGGINEHLAQLIGLSDLKSLSEYRPQKLIKLVVFVPVDHIDSVRDAMSRNGAGWIGNYSDCSFMTKGTGTFRPLDGTNPYIGSTGNLEKVEEVRLETIVKKQELNRVIDAMIKAHPYEEVAYDVYPLEIKGESYAMGQVGVLKEPVSLEKFIQTVKENLGIKSLRLIGKTQGDIKKVAVFCGSFDESLMGRVKQNADILVAGDIKYHAAVDMIEKGICALDAGHFGTERIIVPRLAELIQKEFGGIEVIQSTDESDPFISC